MRLLQHTLPLLFAVKEVEDGGEGNGDDEQKPDQLRTLQLEAGGVLSKLLLVSIFPDLALIFVFYTTDTWRLSKGVLIGAMPYILGALMVSM